MTTEVELTEERKKELLERFDKAAEKLRNDPNNFQSGGYCLLLKKERNRPVVLLITLRLDSNFLHWGDITVKKEKLPKKMTMADLVEKGWILLGKESAGSDEKYVREAFYHDRILFHHATLTETCFFRSREDFFQQMAVCLRIGLNPHEHNPINIEELFKL